MSELTEMEKYLQKLFTEAGQDLKKKFLKYTQDFQRLDAAKQQAVEDGNITEDEYKEWRKNKLLYGMHWQRLIDRNTSELLKYNQTAVKYINGEVPQIFASGYNKVAEQIPDSPVAGFDFELINADTVNNLVHEDGIILPPKKKVDPEKDKAWNAKLINAQLLQGIMQGESIPDMAKRMMTVANSDLAGATRTARTMHTAAQNAGRQSGYNKAAQQGIIFEKTWLAANNERTRLSHSLMNGQTVAHDEKFVSPVTGVKLMFPGDWNAEGGDVGSEIYNCFLGETIIASDSDVIRSYKHKYTGKIISVETAGGVKFSCTPNHPILTPRGWIAAEFLKSSDDILVTLRSEVGSARINPYINHAFARIDTIHELFAMFGRKRTCRLGVDFHGDIPTSDVEIITQKRFLWYNIKSVFRNCINKLLFKHADSSLMSKGTSMKHFRSVFLTSFSNVCSMCKSFSFISTGLSHASVHSTGTITRNNVVLTEYSIDNLAAESVLDGDTLSGLSGKVFVDKVVNVNVFNSSTHVYNLQTEYGYYLVNSSITDQSRPDIDIFAIAHNCRCTLITKFRGFKKLNGEEPEHTRREEENIQKPETKSMIPSLSSILEACTTEREISKAAQEYFIAKEGCKIESVDLLRVDPEVARQMVIKLDELDNKYHSSLTEIKARAISDGIGGVTKPNEQSCYEYIKTNDSSVLKSTITLNNKLCKDQNIVKQVFNADNRSSGGLAHGAWVDEDNAALATLVHEYGHTILAGKLNEIAIGMGVENEAYEEAKQVYSDYISELRKIKREMQDVRFKYAGQPDGLRKGNEAAQELQNKYNSTSISKYSESSVGEMIAEAFCDAQLSSNPREYSKRIMKILDREYGK